MKPAILVTGTIDRPDILSIFRDVAPAANLTFLEYLYNYQVRSHEEYYQPYGKLRFWQDFRDANALLDELRPEKIVFFYISSINQVALKLAAQHRNIPTFHLEHGFRQRFSHSLGNLAVAHFAAERRDLRRWRREFFSILGNHSFFVRSLLAAPPAVRGSLMAYSWQSYSRHLSPDLQMKFAPLRQPDRYIAFSPEIFEFHRVQDALGAEDMKRVTFIGLPQFDQFCNLPHRSINPRNVILIDHQFHGGQIFGWTLEFRREWARRLFEIIQKLGLRLFVKPHPGDKSDVWAPYLATGFVELIDHERLRECLAETRTVLGTFSTMQLPLAGHQHTALVTLEIHPEKGHLPSRQFVEAGVAEAVTTFEDLENKLLNIEGVATQQRPHKESFVHQFLYKLDGQAGVRLKDLLVQSTPA